LEILASKTQNSDWEMAKFWPQKRNFSDNPLVELPGACEHFYSQRDSEGLDAVNNPVHAERCRRRVEEP
jgi:hypothetical protein